MQGHLTDLHLCTSLDPRAAATTAQHASFYVALCPSPCEVLAGHIKEKPLLVAMIKYSDKTT